MQALSLMLRESCESVLDEIRLFEYEFSGFSFLLLVVVVSNLRSFREFER